MSTPLEVFAERCGSGRLRGSGRDAGVKIGKRKNLDRLFA